MRAEAERVLRRKVRLLGMLSLKLGRSITWDGDKEQCLNEPDANKLLRREYRKGWEYPT